MLYCYQTSLLWHKIADQIIRVFFFVFYKWLMDLFEHILSLYNNFPTLQGLKNYLPAKGLRFQIPQPNHSLATILVEVVDILFPFPPTHSRQLVLIWIFSFNTNKKQAAKQTKRDKRMVLSQSVMPQIKPLKKKKKNNLTNKKARFEYMKINV